MRAQSEGAMVGILGGMGPMATVDFMTKIISATPASVDQDHVPLIVYDVPQIPDRTQAILTHSDAPFEAMLTGVRMLETAGAAFIAIPCNTAHYWYDRLAQQSRIPILHIADAAREWLAAHAATGRISLLGTRGTIATQIYQRRLADIDLLIPSEPVQTLVDAAIAAVKANDLGQAHALAGRAALHLFDEGVDKLLLACTELPLAFASCDCVDRTIDATAALARACVAASLGNGWLAGTASRSRHPVPA